MNRGGSIALFVILASGCVSESPVDEFQSFPTLPSSWTAEYELVQGSATTQIFASFGPSVVIGADGRLDEGYALALDGWPLDAPATGAAGQATILFDKCLNPQTMRVGSGAGSYYTPPIGWWPTFPVLSGVVQSPGGQQTVDGGDLVFHVVSNDIGYSVRSTADMANGSRALVNTGRPWELAWEENVVPSIVAQASAIGGAWKATLTHVLPSGAPVSKCLASKPATHATGGLESAWADEVPVRPSFADVLRVARDGPTTQDWTEAYMSEEAEIGFWSATPSANGYRWAIRVTADPAAVEEWVLECEANPLQPQLGPSAATIQCEQVGVPRGSGYAWATVKNGFHMENMVRLVHEFRMENATWMGFATGDFVQLAAKSDHATVTFDASMGRLVAACIRCDV